MTLYKKEITEGIGGREISLDIREIESGGDENILTIKLSSIWKEIQKSSTTWEANEALEKKE